MTLPAASTSPSLVIINSPPRSLAITSPKSALPLPMATLPTTSSTASVIMPSSSRMFLPLLRATPAILREIQAYLYVP